MTSIPELNKSITSIPELNRSINLLNEKIDGLIINLDLTFNKFVTITQLEVASAKIIADITKELSEKIDSCPCNKDILEHIKNISIIEQKTKPGKYSGLKKYSPPNPNYDKTDQKLIQLLSLETEECEELYQKEPKLFDQYFRMTKINEPDTESEQEDNFKTNTKTVKFEYSDMEDDEAESSYTATRRGNKKKYEFKMPVHNGIPNSGQGPNTINVLNIDCIQDLKLRERVVEKWVTEISLILQTNPDEFEKAKNVLLLLEHKTDGIVQKFLRNNNWNEELHGSDLFDNLINVIYTTFLGLDYISNKDFTINKKVDIARVSMTKLQLHDISFLDKYTCIIKTKRNTNLFGKRKEENFHQENTSRNHQKKHLRKLLPVRKERKNVGVGSAMKKDATPTNVQIEKKYPDKVKVLQTANNEGYKALEEEYDGTQHVFIYHVETESSSDTEEYESTTDDSD
uniref:Uncharacterized protein n=1 Tax=Lactuca sativa TaxID=4236 RepID=A0A9R1WTL9_LACSA|nr:hypothetical protein LSAT_V11C900468470 [Lactuca sativa]